MTDQKDTTPAVAAETPKETTPEPAAVTPTPVAEAADEAAATATEEEHSIEKLFVRGLSWSTRELTLARFIEAVAPVFVFPFFYPTHLSCPPDAFSLALQQQVCADCDAVRPLDGDRVCDA